jgi:transcription antitermination factor NusG
MKWYVVYTRPRWEKKVSSILDQKGIENYCPLNKVIKQWSDRKKTVLEPLFKGYVFVKIEDIKKWEIKKVDGIINYIHWLGKPAIVKDSEINAIRRFLTEFENVEIVDNQLEVNSIVKINQGVLMDYKGIVIEIIDNKARVQIDSMGIRLSAIFDKKKISIL